MCGLGKGKALCGVGTGETVIKIYGIKKSFQRKQKKNDTYLLNIYNQNSWIASFSCPLRYYNDCGIIRYYNGGGNDNNNKVWKLIIHTFVKRFAYISSFTLS